jgi:hypothetical protein
MKFIDLTDTRFGRLIAKVPVRKQVGKKIRIYWECLCDCGNKTTCSPDSLKIGTTSSCGCLLRETTRKRSITHGHRINRKYTPELKSWTHAKSRCFNPNNPKYKRYGGRGITMHESWVNDFLAFFNYIGKKPSPKHTLDRIENNGNYEPGNVRWALPKQQAMNSTTPLKIEWKNQILCLKEIAESEGVGYKWLHAQIRYKNKTIEQAISEKRT